MAPFSAPTARRLPPRSWLRDEATEQVLDALSARRALCRFVGGCVRDGLLGRPVQDVDIATPEPPETVLALLERAGIRAVPTGLEHGTVTAVTPARHYEITTLRRDVQTFGRHAEVAFTEDWAADAARRDFTINALYADRDGTVHDFVGGLPDLDAGRVRFIGDPMARIHEDYLRILRFFRFSAWYGRGPLDPAGLSAVTAEREGLRRLSGERVRVELLRLLAAPDPAPVLAAMRASGVLDVILPEADGLDPLAALIAREQARGLADPLRRLAALLRPDLEREALRALAARLRLSNAERERLCAMMGLPREALGDGGDAAIRRAIYRFGADLVRDLALLRGAPDLALALHLVAEWHPPPFPIGGADIMAAGVPQGPAVGEVLRALEEWWLAQDFAPDRDALLERLNRAAAGLRD
jgi:poly(A) polymerase